MYEPDRQLNASIAFLWVISRTIRFALFGIPFSIFIFVATSFMVNWKFGVAITSLYVVYSLIRAWVWPVLEYRYYRYAVRDNDLIVQQGVLFRKWSTIPLHRIQHVDTRQGPLERMIGIASLQLYTAAGMHADGSIPGLDTEEAENLRDTLSQIGGDDGV